MTNEPTSNRSANDDAEVLERLVDEFTQKIRAGEYPAIADYQNQYPHLAAQIEDLFESAAMLEQLKPSPESTPNAKRVSLDQFCSLEKIGDYRIERELGRGGMGIVFQAIHESLGRRVAIKLMPTPIVNSEKYIERFKRESQAAARLHHTNIVNVFGVGEGPGYHYYVMDLVDGQTLGRFVQTLSMGSGNVSTLSMGQTTSYDIAARATDVTHSVIRESSELPSVNDAADLAVKSCAESPATQMTDLEHFRWVAKIGSDLADALAYAHRANILHRDIKPANLMLDQQGRVWITDFGLAKDDSAGINLTKTGDVIGTPQYLSPESLKGHYDQRSEVYGLGLTLYELVTLRPAYPAGSTAEVIASIATTSPIPVRKLNPNTPRDLSVIIEKTLDREPHRRYQTAEELRNDLLAFVEDRPIAARPPSVPEQVVKWGRRNPLAALLAGVSAMLLCLVAISASIGYVSTTNAFNQEADKSARLQLQQLETERQRVAAEDARKKAEENAQRMKIQFDRAETNIAITLDAFDQMFKQVVSRDAASGTGINIDGFEELTGIETSITHQDAEFLENLLSFYERFASENSDSQSLKIESARAFRRVANIYQLIGESSKAVEAYRQAIMLYKNIATKTPDAKETLIALVQTKNELSRSYRQNRKWKQAVEENEQAIKLLESVSTEQLDNELKFELAKTLNSLGSGATLIASIINSGSTQQNKFHFFFRGQRPVFGTDHQRAPPFSTDRKPAKPKRNKSETPGAKRPDQHRRRPHGRSRGNAELGRPRINRRTSQYSQQAIEILDALIDEEPDNDDYRAVRANCYCSLSAMLLRSDPIQAMEMRERAIDELESLVEVDPGHAEYQYRLALACSLGGDVGRSKSEIELLSRAAKIVSDLTEQFPQVLDYFFLRGAVENKLAGYLIDDGELDAALKAVRVAKTSFEYIAQKSPSDRAVRPAFEALGSQIRRLIGAAKDSENLALAQEAKSLLDQLRPSKKRKR